MTTVNNAFSITHTATLKNGAEIIEAYRKGDDVVVLAKWKGHAVPFVTWRVSVEDGSCYWGHYFHELDEARADFEARVESL